MNEQKNNGRGIFYGVIGVATLVVAIIGATFAYFTATAANNVMTGNMASIKLNLSVDKVTHVDEDNGGMIPMSNSMVEVAINTGLNTGLEGDKRGDSPICVDDNGNAVCQIYKIVLTNNSSAGQFVDGYIALRGGSGKPTDMPYILTGDTNEDGICQGDETGCKKKIVDSSKDTDNNGICDSGETGCAYELYDYDELAEFPTDIGSSAVDGGSSSIKTGTTMRWAQVFCTEFDDETGDATSCSTGGDQYLLNDIEAGEGNYESKVSIAAIDGNSTDAHNLDNVKVGFKAVTGKTSISGNQYDTIVKNYIRLSNHKWATGESAGKDKYDRNEDITSALVFNHSLTANKTATYYFVVWLSETGTDQTADTKVEGGTADTDKTPAAAKFYSGNVTFNSAQGSEVSATFSGYAKVQSDNA